MTNKSHSGVPKRRAVRYRHATAAMAEIATTPFETNGVRYTPPPAPVAVLCIDGCADEYLDAALVRGHMPRLAAMLAGGGHRSMVRGALPSFTNAVSYTHLTLPTTPY